MSEKIYNLLENPKTKSFIKINFIIYGLIILNLTAIALESIDEIRINHKAALENIEHFTMILFSFEYILRLISAKHTQIYKTDGLLGYLTSATHLIDFIALVPYYVTFFGFNSTFLRGFRLLRVFKLLHMNKLSKFDDLLKKIFRERKEEFLFLLAFTLVVLIVVSFLVYHFEHEVQPEVFTSIPETIWWSIVTLTTVGYGDMFPVTAVGKFLTSIFVLLGVAFVAIPSAILASSFVEEFERKRDKDKRARCYKCKSTKIEIENVDLTSSGGERFQTLMHKCQNCGNHWGTFT